MRCYICDQLLSPEEIKFSKHNGKLEPCNTCLDIINDAADIERGAVDHDFDDVIIDLEPEQEEILDDS